MKRVLVLGDSFTWGFGVEQEQIFTEVIENSRKDVEVINAGVSGYSPDQELIWLREQGMHFQPDLVLLLENSIIGQLPLRVGIRHALRREVEVGP